MKSFGLIIALFFLSFSVFSQEKYIKHRISKGENLSVIAKKYNVKIKAILDLNPKASKLLKLNSILLIPSSQKNIVDKTKKTFATNPQETTIHKIQAKETLYGISKRYQITVEELKKANPKLKKEKLKKGQQLTIPIKTRSIIAENSESDITENKAVETTQPEKIGETTGTGIVRKVLPKETKYAIAKEYGISVAELEKQNPAAKEKLLVGSVLKINPSSTYVKNEVQEDTKTSIDSTAVTTRVAEDSITATTKFTYNTDLSNQLISDATENIGVRYRFGGTTKSGFDCSGLMVTTFGKFDIKLPRSSIEQSRTGVKITSEQAKKGDLIFFKTNGRRRINHVGMVIEANNGEIKFIHSSIRHGVIISSTKEAYYKKHFMQVNRILE